MPLMEEVDEGAEESKSAEMLRAERRQKRSKAAAAAAAGSKAKVKVKKKKRQQEQVGDYPTITTPSIVRVVLLAAFILCVGLYSLRIARYRKSNHCRMTWSKPIYVPLPVRRVSTGGVVVEESPGYGYRLLRYLDGNLPAEDRDESSVPRGRPVIFVPGHLGRFEQVRSMGVHAAKEKVQSAEERLDFFALDFGGEWTALHGSFLWKQAEFLNHAVGAVLELYSEGKASSPRTSVMILGHSLGGLVARAAFTLPSFRPGSVTDIMTLGTPHYRSSWGIDDSILRVYQCTDALWRWRDPGPSTGSWCPKWTRGSLRRAVGPESVGEPAVSSLEDVAGEDSCEARGSADEDSEEDCRPAVLLEEPEPAVEGRKEGLVDGGLVNASGVGWGGGGGASAELLLENVVLVSVSGGVNDLMVHPSLCVTEGLGLEGQSLAVTTNTIRDCLFGVDHLALVWCLQLGRRLTGSLSELAALNERGVDARTRATSAFVQLTRLSPPSDRGLDGIGFAEAALESGDWIVLSRSLLTDRSIFLIPAWFCICGLVLAASLLKSLGAKNSKERALPSSPLSLLLPATHLQLSTMESLWRRWWVSLRSASTPVQVLLGVVVSVVALRCGVADIATVPGLKNVVAVVSSIRGFSAVLGVLAPVMTALDSLVGTIVSFFNPFHGAGDALGLPPVKALVAIYLVTLGAMIVFVFLGTMLGEMGKAFFRLLTRLPTPLAAVVRPLSSYKAGSAIGCAALLAVFLASHLESYSFPPTFRRPTMIGEASCAFLSVSLAILGLLGSFILLPSSTAAEAAHQRMLLLLYGPTPLLLLGSQLAAVRVLFLDAGGNTSAYVSTTALVFMSVALLPVLGSVWCARVGYLFPSPPSIRGVVLQLQERMQRKLSEQANGSNGVGRNTAAGKHHMEDPLVTDENSGGLEHPHGHGACGGCLHEDGGRGAIFVETEKGSVSVGEGVTLGPGFRVIACDCPMLEPAAPSTWCEFCSCVCDVCGGCIEAVKALRRARKAADGRRGSRERGSDGEMQTRLGHAGLAGVVSVVFLYLGLWSWGMKMIENPCHSIFALYAIGMVLCLMHSGLLSESIHGR